MAQANKGDTVQVHYTGKLQDGTVFDSSEGRDPIEFKIGEGQVIPGFEKAVEGLEEGEKTEATIPADEAYGQYSDEAVATLPRNQFPDDLDVQVGQQLQMQNPQGQVFSVRVADVDEENEQVTLDANHPLAGKDLTFELELVKVG
ncbi:MAG: FKBP-type peptidyl-prolyl cis-trans isomerase [Phycisphaeraceae bacterium]